MRDCLRVFDPILSLETLNLSTLFVIRREGVRTNHEGHFHIVTRATALLADKHVESQLV